MVGFLFYLYSTQILRFSIKVNETFITQNTIPDNFDGVRIIQFSDLLITNKRELKLLENAVNSINQLQPDIVVFTGNLFSEKINHNTFDAEVTTLLKEINSNLGKIAVLGNTDLSRNEVITQILMDASFYVLRNDSME